MLSPFGRCSLFASFAAILLLASCAKQDALTSAIPAAREADLLDLGDLLSPKDTATTILFIDPAFSSTYTIAGGHRLWVRAGGVCELASEYGREAWNLPCVSAVLPTLIIARSWIDADLHPHVEFTPSLRFLPLDDNSPSAELWLRDRSASTSKRSVIAYCNEVKCIDESADDPSLATSADPYRGYLFRRIKHFSGYQVSTGRDDPPVDSIRVDP